MIRFSKFLKFKIFIFLIFICSSNVNAQRNLVWAHGLKENTQAWQKYIDEWGWGTKYPSTPTNHVNKAYNSSSGLVGAAAEVQLDLDTELGSNFNNPNNIAIGHSTGSLAFRHIDGTTNTNDKRFGGIISIGTSHHGLNFADAINNGDLQAFHSDALDKVKSLYFSTTFTEFGKTWTHNDFRLAAKDFAWSYMSSSTTGSTNATTLDLETNSSFMSNLPSSFSKPSISIYGNEQNKSFWRMLSSQDKKPYSLGLNSLGGEEWMRAAIRMENRYNNAIYSHIALLGVALATVVPATIAALVPGNILGLAFAITNYAVIIYTPIHIANARKGRNWFRDVESKWRRLMGAVRTQTYTYTYSGMSQYCLAQIAQFGWGWYYGNSANQQLCYGNPITITGTQFVNESSDGLVPFSSTQLPFTTSLEATGANHFELYNHPGVSDAFNQIFTGQHGAFFKLD